MRAALGGGDRTVWRRWHGIPVGVHWIISDPPGKVARDGLANATATSKSSEVGAKRIPRYQRDKLYNIFLGTPFTRLVSLILH